MGPCLGDPRLCWASGLLGVISLLSVCSNSAEVSRAPGPGSEDPKAPVLLKGIQGGSVWFHVTEWPGKDPGDKLEEITWRFGSGSQQRMILRMQSGADAPTWLTLRDKYKPRAQVPNMTSLGIRNLSPQDSGEYWAEGLSTLGKELHQVSHLKVYESVSPPQILAKAVSITPGWCNVTLECRAAGDTENLNVTWESKGLPRELELSGTPGPALNPWTQAVSLPLSQAHARLTCVVSNPMDQNNATSDLGDICSRGASGQSATSLTGGLIGGFVVVLLLLGAGLYLWKIHEKKKKKKISMGQGAGLQQDRRVYDDDIMYAQVTKQKSHEDKDKGTGEQHLDEEGLTTVYSEVGVPGQPLKMI